ncbi:MAG TPA: response regulator [Oligoflexus sp.]|uniref:response regulator n=1 Tax=Oligoflexus sp. TaxID=1971216 RepID=UPI002D7E3257|nr:response regulator [Oligoflexus sp.]HET9236164.1 response regulator [Oligoflexus sp.]
MIALVHKILRVNRERFPEEREWLKAVNRSLFQTLYALAWSCYVITYLILDTTINAALCGGLGLGSTLIGLAILRHSTNTAAATHVVHIGALLTLLAICHFTGGISSPIYTWLFALVICNFLLMGQRRGIIFACITLVACVINYMIQLNWPVGPVNAFFETQALSFGLFRLLTYSLSLSLVCVLTYTFAKNQFDAYESTRLAHEQIYKQKVELDQQHEQLISMSHVLKLQKEQLEEANEKLKDTDVQKTRFFQNISHELRTPLTLILGSIQQARREVGDLESLQVLQRNANRLLRLVNQLLDFQKLAAGHGELKLQPIDLRRFTQQISEYFETPARQNQVRFHLDHTDLSPESVIRVLGEIDGLEKIVFNYLSNALKYTPPGGTITLKLSMMGPEVRVTVSDTGPGIPEQQIQRLFQVFSQVEQVGGRKVEGTGLGLALTKEIAERMKGSVGVSSEVGKGSQFWVTLPLMKADRPHIDCLLVTQNAVMQKAFMAHFEASPFTMRAAASLDEAQGLLQNWDIQIVCLDVALPQGRAFEILDETVRLLPESKRILIQPEGVPYETPRTFNPRSIDRMISFPFLAEDLGYLHDLLVKFRLLDHADFVKFLVVDDDSVCLQQTIACLEKLGGLEDICVAASYPEAIELLKTYRFACILSDENIGSDPGSKLLAEAKVLQPETTRILITADQSPELRQKVINSGSIDHVLYKPVRKEELQPLLEGRVKAQSQSNSSESSSANYKDWLLAGSKSQGREGLIRAEAQLREGQARILVVDDLPDMRHLIAESLLSLDYGVIEAEDGRRALEMARNYRPDLIISDWMMPHLNGPELLKELQADAELQSTPTILLTAKGDELSRIEAMQLGAIAFLSKPFDIAELVNTVHNLIRLKESEKKIKELNRHMREHVLQRFFPAQVLKRICEGEVAFGSGSSLLPVTILFADLCEFTRNSSVLGPRKISEILNVYLSRMSDIAFAHGGTVDKFIGDGVMLIFGAPEPLESAEQVRRACACALAMQEAIEDLQKTWQAQGLPLFQMRVGIHHGPALVGMFGNERRSDYTVIGPTVNIASRVESAAEPGAIFITQVVRDYLDGENQWQSAGGYKLKGIDGESQLYRLLKTPNALKAAG